MKLSTRCGASIKKIIEVSLKFRGGTDVYPTGFTEIFLVHSLRCWVLLVFFVACALIRNFDPAVC